MTLFFSADHHFYHKNVITYCKRPFTDVDHMNEMMVKYWNETVGPDDTVYYLGDFSLAHRAVTVLLPRLNGEIHLKAAGNHDHVHPIHAKGKEDRLQRMRKIYYAAGFKSIRLQDEMDILGKHVILHHMPYSGDSGEQERHRSWRPIDNGFPLLHGHVHEHWKVNGRQINVGVDVWNFRPVPLCEVEKLIGAMDV